MILGIESGQFWAFLLVGGIVLVVTIIVLAMEKKYNQMVQTEHSRAQTALWTAIDQKIDAAIAEWQNSKERWREHVTSRLEREIRYKEAWQLAKLSPSAEEQMDDLMGVIGVFGAAFGGGFPSHHRQISARAEEITKQAMLKFQQKIQHLQ